MDTGHAPTFEEWSDYCFTRGYADFHASAEGAGAAQSCATRFLSLTPRRTAEYISRLFENSRGLERTYSSDQIAQATWFIFGIASGYFHEVRSPANPTELQLRCFRSVLTLYVDLFDRLCNHGGHSCDDRTDDEPLDVAVYMIWDMDSIEGAVMFPDEAPHLAEAGFEVLQGILTRCRTGSCLKSALHGLGHIHTLHPERTSRVVLGFIEQRRAELPAWLLEYAEQARRGAVL